MLHLTRWAPLDHTFVEEILENRLSFGW